MLFNTNIFPDRGTAHSESWILGGAEDPGVVNLDDETLFARVANDRRRVYGRDAKPLAMFPASHAIESRWQKPKSSPRWFIARRSSIAC